MEPIGKNLFDQIRVQLAEDEEDEIPAGLTGATATIFLSITLIMITYFVFLNAIGRPAEKLQQQAVDSVRRSFRGFAGAPESAAMHTRLADLRDKLSSFTDGGRLGSLGQASDVGRIEVQFEPTQVFTENGEIAAAALESISGIMGAAAESKLPIKIDIAVPEDSASSEQSLKSFAAAATRASGILRLYLDRGGNRALISGGGRVTSDKLPLARLTILASELKQPDLRRRPRW